MTSALKPAISNLMLWTVLIFGVVSFGNALWMLAGPMHWYTELPMAIPDTGPFNLHFVRDVGCAFIAAGVALIWGFYNARYRAPLVAMGALFLAAHAMIHAYDTLRGALGHEHWLLDLPLVYLPGIAVPLIAVRLLREDRGTAS